MDAAREKTVRGRFAPSPTGRMHAGNIFSALVSWLIVRSQGGVMVLRVEDLDRERSRKEYIDQVQYDFEHLGLTWDEGPFWQHDRDEAYEQAFDLMNAQGLIYPCFCSRADLHAASAPHQGEKLVYAGTCARLSKEEQAARMEAGDRFGLRLRVSHDIIGFTDAIQGYYEQKLDRDCGDFLIRRSDDAFAYQLAVVVDDGSQGINSVTRGVDLLCSTPQQIYLQRLLGYEEPEYAHVPLLVAADGRRLAKRNHDAALDALLETYGSPQAVLGHIAYITGMIKADEPHSAEELLAEVDLDKAFAAWKGHEAVLFT